MTSSSGDPTCTAAAGIALENALLGQVLEEGRGALHLWMPSDIALVVPGKLTHEPLYETARTRLAKQGLPVIVRGSGGDVVLQAPGCINIEMAFPLPQAAAHALGVEGAYGVICDPLVDLLRAHGLDAHTGAIAGAFCDGRFNVNIAGRKLAGTAQRWRAGHGGMQALLVHAVVLDHLDPTVMAQTINHFYALCGIDRRCDPDCHVTLEQALGPGVDATGRLQALARAYAHGLERF